MNQMYFVTSNLYCTDGSTNDNIPSFSFESLNCSRSSSVIVNCICISSTLICSYICICVSFNLTFLSKCIQMSCCIFQLLYESPMSDKYVLCFISKNLVGVQVQQFNNKICSRHDIAEILLKLVLSNNHSINQSVSCTKSIRTVSVAVLYAIQFLHNIKLFKLLNIMQKENNIVFAIKLNSNILPEVLICQQKNVI